MPPEGRGAARAVGLTHWLMEWSRTAKPGLGRGALILGPVLAGYADWETGSNARPSRARLVIGTGLATSTVSRNLRALVDARWLEVQDRRPARPTVYRLTIPQTDAEAEAEARRAARLAAMDDIWAEAQAGRGLGSGI